VKRYLFIVIVIFLFINLILCGCIGEREQKTDSEKLIGTWKAEDSFYRMYKFFKDGTCLINNYEKKGTYYINNEGQLVINQTEPSVSFIYEYTLNYNNDKLTLRDIKTDDVYIYRKQ